MAMAGAALVVVIAAVIVWLGRSVPRAPCPDLQCQARRFAIITTAAFPWNTGTAVNPMLRAAHLSNKGHRVTLVVPWVPPEHQCAIFPRGLTFESSVQQEQHVRAWLRANVTPVPLSLRIQWYPGAYDPRLGSIIQARGTDLALLIPTAERDVAILEEPEHLTWYHHGSRWTSLYRHVVGVRHTNYAHYVRVHVGPSRAHALRLLNRAMYAMYTNGVINLSRALDDVPGRSVVSNVHGVRGEFLAIGAQAGAHRRSAYFIAKALWSKGYRELLDNLAAHAATGGAELPLIRTYGTGPDEEAIRVEALPLGVQHAAGIDHAHPSLREHAVFVNPSTSEVLCTATAEALAMGKRVVIPDHPSNAFFRQFANAAMYPADHPERMGARLLQALSTPPVPLTAEERHMLTWEAATERFLGAASFCPTERRGAQLLRHLLYGAHWTLT